MDRNLSNPIIRWRVARVAKDAKSARLGWVDRIQRCVDELS
jgi:hypothetical protein